MLWKSLEFEYSVFYQQSSEVKKGGNYFSHTPNDMHRVFQKVLDKLLNNILKLWNSAK